MTQEEARKLLIIQPTVNHSAKVNAWASMAEAGPGSLHFIVGNLDALQFVRILDEHVKDDGNRLCGSGFFHQQDNDPKHKSRLATKWLTKNKVKTLQWPSNYPDMSPIENMFHLLKKRVRDRTIRDIVHFKEVFKEEWEAISKLNTSKFVRSMPQRLAALGKSKGRHTKY
ncbi:MAG: putative Transposable element Tcb1 transposase [Streblomastix strix]|uniref:Putative Transposable element Tcb1 transposase n=1 Tax=Streblomastix strix TaxID=222440 RepID=A0A5J4U443_9EUKA|nr:MAG: putative Transposable element Tcb1 transposase [Streblomastix strix]